MTRRGSQQIYATNIYNNKQNNNKQELRTLYDISDLEKFLITKF